MRFIQYAVFIDEGHEPELVTLRFNLDVPGVEKTLQELLGMGDASLWEEPVSGRLPQARVTITPDDADDADLLDQWITQHIADPDPTARYMGVFGVHFPD
jgi:hypothetical protein